MVDQPIKKKFVTNLQLKEIKISKLSNIRVNERFLQTNKPKVHEEIVYDQTHHHIVIVSLPKK